MERAFRWRRARRWGAWPPDLGLLEVGLLGFFLDEIGYFEFEIFFCLDWLCCIFGLI